MESVLIYIGRANHCQMLAIAAHTARKKAEYLDLAALWLDLAESRRRTLSVSAQEAPNGP